PVRRRDQPGPVRGSIDMSTMQQQAPPAEAVEEQMGKIVTELGAALGVLLTSLGTRSGLWAALAGAGPLTTTEVAAKVSVEPSLVREWLRAQAAGGYLDYDPATGTFTLPDAVAAAICHGPGGALVDAAATMFSSMGEGFAAFSEAFSTGQGFGWHQRTVAHWHGTDAFTRVALPAELIAAAIDEMVGVAAVLAAGGSVATAAVLRVEPLGAADAEDTLTPAGRMFYAVSTLACTPNAVSQKTATSSEPLGLAGQQRLRAVAADAGFGRVRRLDIPAPMNLVLELRP